VLCEDVFRAELWVAALQASKHLSEVSEVGRALTKRTQITVLSEDPLWVSSSRGSLGCNGALQVPAGKPLSTLRAPRTGTKHGTASAPDASVEHLLTRQQAMWNDPGVSAVHPGKHQLELQTFLKSLLGTNLCIRGQQLTQKNPAVGHLQMVGLELQKATEAQR